MIRKKQLKAARVGVIGKVLRILELLDRSQDGLHLKEIAGQSGLNKSTAHRFLTHLEMEGYLFRDPHGKYMLGPKLVRMGGGASFQATLCKIARPALEQLRSFTGETVNLAMLDGVNVVYLDVLQSLHTFRLATEVGARRPIQSTSLGKAILAHLTELPLQEEIISRIVFAPTTPKGIADATRLRKDLIRIKSRGFSLDDEEAVTGARCIGAPIFDGDGRAIGGISVSGPVVRVTRAQVAPFSAAICSAAREISEKLGYQAANSSGSSLLNAPTASRAHTLEAQLRPKSKRWSQAGKRSSL
ncbi:MAG: IclR family transcriptional regulator [Acidobacteriaceae bacterium]